MTPNWKEHRCPSTGEWINCGISIKWKITSNKNGQTDILKNMDKFQKHSQCKKLDSMSTYWIIPFI